MVGWLDRLVGTITQILDLVLGEINILQKYKVVKYCGLSKDYFLDNLERLMEITVFLETVLTGPEMNGKQMCGFSTIWSMSKDNKVLVMLVMPWE